MFCHNKKLWNSYKDVLKGECFMNFRKMNAWLMAVSLTATAAGSSVMPLYMDATQLGMKKSANEETLGKDKVDRHKDEKYYDVDQYGVVTGYKGEKTNLVLPEKKYGKKICEIGQEAFQNQKDICSVVLPEGVEEIGKDAFFNCTSLVSIEFPDTLSVIGMGAFQNCIQLQRIDLSKTNITRIPEGAFQNCRNLVEVILPKGLCSIEANAFYSCGNLKNFYLANLKKLTKIGSGAFANCISLTKLTIPQTVKSISGGAFANCIGLEEITLPGRVQELGLAVLAGNQKVTVKTVKNSLAYDYAMKNKLKVVPTSEEILVAKIEITGKDITHSKENVKKLIIKEGSSRHVEVKISKEATDKTVFWECNKEGIVNISEQGNITGVKKGFVIAQVMAKGGVKKTDCLEISVI